MKVLVTFYDGSPTHPVVSETRKAELLSKTKSTLCLRFTDGDDSSETYCYEPAHITYRAWKSLGARVRGLWHAVNDRNTCISVAELRSQTCESVRGKIDK